MADKTDYRMTAEEFRRHGKAMVDWIADYYARIESFPVLSQVKPGQIRAALPASAPEQGEPFEAMMKDIESVILPGVTHWQSPNFFAYFPSNTSYPSILGELLSAGLDVQGMLWVTSPACTELETHVLDWLVEMSRASRKIQVEQHGRRSDSGYGVELVVMRVACRARARDGILNQ